MGITPVSLCCENLREDKTMYASTCRTLFLQLLSQSGFHLLYLNSAENVDQMMIECKQ